METKKLAKILKALSNENRLELFLEIARREETCFEDETTGCYIQELKCQLNIGAPTISHHLKELENAELIITARRGKFLVARINHETRELVRTMLSV